MSTRANSSRITSSRRLSKQKDTARGRRSRARLGRTFETVTMQPVRVRNRAGLLQSCGARSHHVVGLMLLTLLVSVVAFFFISYDFFIWEMEVTGHRWLTPAQVYQASTTEGHSIFYVDPNAVARRIERLPAVQRARVACSLPNHISVEIIEREPVAIWQAQDVQYWVDTAGVLFPRAVNLEDVVIIVEQNTDQRRIGARVDARAVAAATSLSQLMPLVGVYGFSDADGLWFDLPEGVRVRIPVDADGGQMAAALYALQEYFRGEDIQPGVVDLRYQGRAIWR